MREWLGNLRGVLSRDERVVASYRAASWFLSNVPSGTARALANVGGLIAFAASPNKRRLVKDNLMRVLGDGTGSSKGKGLTLKAYRSYAKYWTEMLVVGTLTRRELNAGMSFHGFEHIYEALGGGKGVIFTTPHLGNWDFGAAWLASGGYPITAVMEELKPRQLFEWFADHRTSFGVRVIPTSSNAFAELAKSLSRNEVVALVADRDLMNSGVMVSFFGEVTSIPQGVALLSLRSGAPIVPAAVYMLPNGCHYGIATEPISFSRSGSLREDVTTLTELLIGRYESLIRADPAQWHLFQANWPSQMGTSRFGAAV